jgi:hypothetical protein
LKAAHKRGFIQGFIAGGEEGHEEGIKDGFFLGYRSGVVHQQAVCDSQRRLSGQTTSRLPRELRARREKVWGGSSEQGPESSAHIGGEPTESIVPQTDGGDSTLALTIGTRCSTVPTLQASDASADLSQADTSK